MVNPERASHPHIFDGPPRSADHGIPSTWPAVRAGPGDWDPAIQCKIEDAFRALLVSSGMCDALRFLNARTRYRFTGVYRVDPPLLRNMYLIDRENPLLSLGGDVAPLGDTYCGIVAATSAPFLASDSAIDTRLSRHPARDSVVSYVGVPVRRSDGRVFGTLCHFDLRPRILALDELAVLEASSQCISDWLSTMHPASD